MIRAARKMMGMDLPSKIDRLLDQRAWTRSDLARRIGRAKQNVHNWTSGVEPKRVDLLRIARALEVPVEYLIDDAQDTPPPPVLSSDEQTLLDVMRASGITPVSVLTTLALRSVEPGLSPHDKPPASPGKPNSQAS